MPAAQRNMQLSKAETSYKDMLFKHQGLIRQLQEELKAERANRRAPVAAASTPGAQAVGLSASTAWHAAAADSASGRGGGEEPPPQASGVGGRKRHLAVMERMEEEMGRLEVLNEALEKRATAADKAARDAQRSCHWPLCTEAAAC